MSIRVEIRDGRVVEVVATDFGELVRVYAPCLAEDGIFVAGASQLPPGSPVELKVALDDGFALIEGSGTVEWCRPASPSEAGGFAIRLQHLASEGRGLIERMVTTLRAEGGRVFDLERERPKAAPKPESAPEPAQKPWDLRAELHEGVDILDTGEQPTFAPGMDKARGMRGETVAPMSNELLGTLRADAPQTAAPPAAPTAGSDRPPFSIEGLEALGEAPAQRPVQDAGEDPFAAARTHAESLKVNLDDELDLDNFELDFNVVTSPPPPASDLAEGDDPEGIDEIWQVVAATDEMMAINPDTLVEAAAKLAPTDSGLFARGEEDAQFRTVSLSAAELRDMTRGATETSATPLLPLEGDEPRYVPAPARRSAPSPPPPRADSPPAAAQPPPSEPRRRALGPSDGPSQGPSQGPTEPVLAGRSVASAKPTVARSESAPTTDPAPHGSGLYRPPAVAVAKSMRRRRSMPGGRMAEITVLVLLALGLVAGYLVVQRLYKEKPRQDGLARIEDMGSEGAVTSEEGLGEGQSSATIFDLSQLPAGLPRVDVLVATPVASPVTRVDRVSTQSGPDGTEVTLWGDGSFSALNASLLRLDGESPRQVVQVSGIVAPHAIASYRLDTSEVIRLRFGYHLGQPFNELHAVADLVDPSVRLVHVMVVDRRMILLFSRQVGTAKAVRRTANGQ